MNAIAVAATTGAVIDPWGGEADIALALIRAVGSPEERFAEDPLRLLRAARLVSQLGFRLDWLTEQAMAAQAPELRRISQERILGEMNRLLIGPYVDHGLDVMRRTGLLRVALPELEPLVIEAEANLSDRFGREKDLWDHTVKVVRQAPPRATVRAERDSKVRVVKDAMRILEKHPELALRIAQLQSQRLDATSALLVELNHEHGDKPAERSLIGRIFSTLMTPGKDLGSH